MADNDTLLANLIWRFPGHQEDIATEALAHILAKSDAAVEALNDVVQSGVRDVKPVVGLRTQVLGIDGSLPDLVGFDEDQKERVIVEVKFWANLTDNQPNGYLARLPEDGPAALVFLAPEDRIRWLWPELRGRVERQYVLSSVESERRCFRIGDTQRHLMLVSWTGLLDSMAARSGESEEPAGIGIEIRQLRSLAHHADTGAFKPIVRGEEFGADSERREREYKRLINQATERGVAEGWASRKGLRATPRPYGFGRYISLGKPAVWFGINVELFESTGETPLWVHRWPDTWVPVNLIRDAEYSAVLEGVVDSLRYIATELRP